MESGRIYPITLLQRSPKTLINSGYSHNRCNEVKIIFKTLSTVVSATLNNVFQTALLTYRQIKKETSTDR